VVSNATGLLCWGYFAGKADKKKGKAGKRFYQLSFTLFGLKYASILLSSQLLKHLTNRAINIFFYSQTILQLIDLQADYFHTIFYNVGEWGLGGLISIAGGHLALNL